MNRRVLEELSPNRLLSVDSLRQKDLRDGKEVRVSRSVEIERINEEDFDIKAGLKDLDALALHITPKKRRISGPGTILSYQESNVNAGKLQSNNNNVVLNNVSTTKMSVSQNVGLQNTPVRLQVGNKTKQMASPFKIFEEVALSKDKQIKISQTTYDQSDNAASVSATPPRNSKAKYGLDNHTPVRTARHLDAKERSDEPGLVSAGTTRTPKRRSQEIEMYTASPDVAAFQSDVELESGLSKKTASSRSHADGSLWSQMPINDNTMTSPIQSTQKKGVYTNAHDRFVGLQSPTRAGLSASNMESFAHNSTSMTGAESENSGHFPTASPATMFRSSSQIHSASLPSTRTTLPVSANLFIDVELNQNALDAVGVDDTELEEQASPKDMYPPTDGLDIATEDSSGSPARSNMGGSGLKGLGKRTSRQLGNLHEVHMSQSLDREWGHILQAAIASEENATTGYEEVPPLWHANANSKEHAYSSAEKGASSENGPLYGQEKRSLSARLEAIEAELASMGLSSPGDQQVDDAVRPMHATLVADGVKMVVDRSAPTNYTHRDLFSATDAVNRAADELLTALNPELFPRDGLIRGDTEGLIRQRVSPSTAVTGSIEVETLESDEEKADILSARYQEREEVVAPSILKTPSKTAAVPEIGLKTPVGDAHSVDAINETKGEMSTEDISALSFAAFHRMITEARIRSSRALLRSLDKEHVTKTTTLIGQQLDAYRALNQREREAAELAGSENMNTTSAEDQGLSPIPVTSDVGVFATTLPSALCEVTRKKIRETPVKAAKPLDPDAVPPSAADNIEQYVNVVAQNICPYSVPLRALGDQRRATDTSQKSIKSVVVLTDLTNFQGQFLQWKDKYGYSDAAKPNLASDAAGNA